MFGGRSSREKAMKLLFLFGVVLAISGFAYGSVSYQPPAKKKGKSTKQWVISKSQIDVLTGSEDKWYCDYDTKELSPLNSFKPPGECQIVYCRDDYSMIFERFAKRKCLTRWVILIRLFTYLAAELRRQKIVTIGGQIIRKNILIAATKFVRNQSWKWRIPLRRIPQVIII